MKIFRIFSLIVVGSLFAACDHAPPEDEAPATNTSSVKDVMIQAIAPASDVIWGAGEPETDAQWQAIADAANIVISNSELIKLGGTGPNDNEWAAEPEWQAFADTLLNAGQLALAAAQNQDAGAIFEAGDVLYPPCEECHIRFNPGVQ
jgi:hypothetical protein